MKSGEGKFSELRSRKREKESENNHLASKHAHVLLG